MDTIKWVFILIILSGKPHLPMLQKKYWKTLELGIARILKLMVSHKYIVFFKVRWNYPPPPKQIFNLVSFSCPPHHRYNKWIMVLRHVGIPNYHTLRQKLAYTTDILYEVYVFKLEICVQRYSKGPNWFVFFI